MKTKSLAPTLGVWIVAVVATFTAFAPSFARGADDAYSNIAPLIDAKTLLIVRADLEQIDLDKLAKTVDEIFVDFLRGRNFDAESIKATNREFLRTLDAAKDALEPRLDAIRVELGITEAILVVQRPNGEGARVVFPIPNATPKRKDALRLALQGFVNGNESEIIDLPNGLAIVVDAEKDADFYSSFKPFENKKIETFFEKSVDSTVQVYCSFFSVQDAINAAGSGDAFRELLAKTPADTQRAFETFDRYFVDAEATIDVNSLKIEGSVNFTTAQRAEEIRVGLEKLADFFAETASAEIAKSPEAEQLETYNVAGLSREVIRGFFKCSIPKRSGASLTFETSPETDFALTNPTLVAVAAGVLLPTVQRARSVAQQMQSNSNLKQIMMAMQFYHDVNNCLPPAYTVDENGKPLHSWRVLILPFVEQTALYDKIRLDEPWDSEWNSQFHDQMPDIFQRANAPSGQVGCAYSIVLDEKGPFSTTGKGHTFASIVDGLSNTIGIVERQTPVCWMDPSSELTLEEFLDEATENLTGFNAAFCDGAVFTIRPTDYPEPRQTFKDYVQINDGNVTRLRNRRLKATID